LCLLRRRRRSWRLGCSRRGGGGRAVAPGGVVLLKDHLGTWWRTDARQGEVWRCEAGRRIEVRGKALIGAAKGVAPFKRVVVAARELLR